MIRAPLTVRAFPTINPLPGNGSYAIRVGEPWVWPLTSARIESNEPNGLMTRILQQFASLGIGASEGATSQYERFEPPTIRMSSKYATRSSKSESCS